MYCVLIVMMSTNVEKKFSCFRGGTFLDSLWYFSGHKLGQYAGQELLKSLFQDKTPDLSLKYTLIQVHDQHASTVSSKNKEKKGQEEKIVLK